MFFARLSVGRVRLDLPDDEAEEDQGEGDKDGLKPPLSQTWTRHGVGSVVLIGFR